MYALFISSLSLFITSLNLLSFAFVLFFSTIDCATDEIVSTAVLTVPFTVSKIIISILLAINARCAKLGFSINNYIIIMTDIFDKINIFLKFTCENHSQLI